MVVIDREREGGREGTIEKETEEKFLSIRESRADCVIQTFSQMSEDLYRVACER